MMCGLPPGVAGSQVSLADRERWAEQPRDALSRLLGDRLSLLSDATVLAEPWPRGFDPQVRVEVVFDRLLREASGGAEMAGQISLISGDGRRCAEDRAVPADPILSA